MHDSSILHFIKRGLSLFRVHFAIIIHWSTKTHSFISTSFMTFFTSPSLSYNKDLLTAFKNEERLLNKGEHTQPQAKPKTQ